MILNLKWILITGLTAFSLGATSSWYLTATYKESIYDAKISKANEKSSEELAKALTKAITAERSYNELATKVEVQHAEDKKELDRILVDNQRLARELGGLRDPGRKASCRPTVPADTSTTVSTVDQTSDANLSAEATEFLLEFAREADRAAEYAKTCHDWVQPLIESTPSSNSNHARTGFTM